ncbi:MAG: T9SS type A sorting domain-containing protein [Bacteroidales bacterium]|nr:T9SS type A sorting domain-containing protein [Bacteroidales bacterium]MBN2818033.1 T9SS type A sorting domain-containing protein [Bacteroidales bacterium]
MDIVIVTPKYKTMVSKNKLFLILTSVLLAILIQSGNLLCAQEQNPGNPEVFPNPVAGEEFTIKSDINITEVTVLNILGQQVYNQKYLGENTITILLEARENGVYLVQVKTDDGRVTTKRILFK